MGVKKRRKKREFALAQLIGDNAGFRRSSL